MKKKMSTKMPKPFWREARGCYYVEIDGQQHKLSPTKTVAMEMYYHLMATHGRRDNPTIAKITVAQAIERIIRERAATHRKNTIRAYVHNLTPIGDAFGERRLGDLQPDEILRFIRGYTGRHWRNGTFNDASRWLMFRFVKTLYRWGRDTGLIDFNPIHGIKNPWIVTPRTRVMTVEEYERIMGDRKTNERFKEVLEFLWRTGARPGEIACMQARHLDARRNIVRLQPTEYKTGSRTGLQREIVLPDDLMARLRGYAALRPQGELLRNRADKPWNQRRIALAFRDIRIRLEMPEGLVIYMARHSFVTRKLDETNNMALVAKLVGHTDTTTIQRVYYHPDLDDMDKIVNSNAGSELARAEEIRREVRIARKQSKLGAKNRKVAPLPS